MEKTELGILKKAKAALEGETGIKLDFAPVAAPPGDFRLNVALPTEHGVAPPRNYIAEVKKRLSDSMIGNVVSMASDMSVEGERLVLVAGLITNAQGQNLRRLGISHFDTAGNAYFNEPGLYINISGRKADVVKDEKPLGIFRPAGMKLILALLMQPGLEQVDYRTIEADTGVPRTTICELMNDLQRAGYLTVRSGNYRRLTRRAELMRRWAEIYPEKLRIKQKPVRYHSTKLTGRWWEDIDLREYGAVWGGETGGAKLTKHLRPAVATVYADSALTRLQAKYRLIKDPKGEFEILRAFWKLDQREQVAPPLVVYADLMATADERNIETAKMIYDNYLAPLAKEDP